MLLIFKLNNTKTAHKIIDKSIVIKFGIHRYILYNKKCKIK